jgi:hypothetical protein
MIMSIDVARSAPQQLAETQNLQPSFFSHLLHEILVSLSDSLIEVRLPEETPKGSQRRVAKTGIERGSFSEVQVQSDRAVEIDFEIDFP